MKDEFEVPEPAPPLSSPAADAEGAPRSSVQGPVEGRATSAPKAKAACVPERVRYPTGRNPDFDHALRLQMQVITGE